MKNKELIIDQLIKKIIELKNPSVIGLDTCFDFLPDEYKKRCKSQKDITDNIYLFNKEIINSIKDIVPCVKVQVAYYEKYGYLGMETFKKTLDYAKKSGLFTIADVKRNDIGSTAQAYAEAYFSQINENDIKIENFECDFLTINGYLGTDGIIPFLKEANKYNKGIFVLVKTSNKSSGELQDLKLENGNTLYEQMASLIDNIDENKVGNYGFKTLGAVVGATHISQGISLRRKHKETFFLIPGYGAQGAGASEIAEFFTNGIGGIVNSSRGIICAHKKETNRKHYDCARDAAIKMREDLNKYIGEYNER